MIVYGEGQKAVKPAVHRLARGNDAKDAIGECETKDDECFYKLVADRAKGKDVFMVGHPYGGWTAMKLAILTKKIANLKMLVTIDPISLPHCHSSTFIGSMFSTEPSLDCTRSPILEKDKFARVDLENIASTGRWYHFWQEEYDRLHSGPIPLQNVHLGTSWEDNKGVFLNTEKPLTYSGNDYLNSHIAISRDKARVWKTILKLLDHK